jgi:spermidine synthase
VSIAFFLSGVAGLGYQFAWTRMFAVGLGHEMPGVLAIVAAFFAGFTLGAWLLDRRIAASDSPGRWYAALELAIGAWGLVTIVLIPQLNRVIPALTGPSPSPLVHWLVAFFIPLGAILPATAAMGATLPAMDRLLSRLASRGRTVGAVYALNTLGAVGGTIVTTFLLVPAIGFRLTLIALAAANVACALIVAFGPADPLRLGHASKTPSLMHRGRCVFSSRSRAPVCSGSGTRSSRCV